MIFKTSIVLPTKGADMAELAMTIDEMEGWTYIEKIMSNKNNWNPPLCWDTENIESMTDMAIDLNQINRILIKNEA